MSNRLAINLFYDGLYIDKIFSFGSAFSRTRGLPESKIASALCI